MIRIYTSAMYVCLCQGVTDQDIVSAVEAGAQSIDDIQHQLGAATGCGSCREYTEQLLNTTLATDISYAA
ncbi:MAG: (2Fe-2S)-binding protein [Pseudomonadales bacterium]